MKSVASPAVQGADIYFNDPVLSVEARPRDSHADPRVSVSTASGKRYEFDEVVATFPLGWLKQNQSAFLPALPKRLSTAIENISYGLLEKVYVHFPETFWHTATDSTSENTATSQTEEDKAARLQSISAFTQFLNPTYTDHPPTPFWNQECLSLAALPEPCAHPTLLFYTYGPCATQIVNQISSMQPDSKEYYDTLDTFLKPYYSRMPGYNPTSAACKPVAFVATKWQLDPWAGHGSYSNFQVGLEEGDQDIEVMREGLGAERGLWFAGEHTAPFVALGTTVGAYWSGELVAEKVCEALEARKGKEEKGEGPMSSNRAELK